MLDCGGTVVGLFEHVAFSQKTLKVAPGSVLVAYSDGLTEAENVYGEEFGMQRLKEAILRQRKLAPQTSRRQFAHCRRSVDRHTRPG